MTVRRTLAALGVLLAAVPLAVSPLSTAVASAATGSGRPVDVTDPAAAPTAFPVVGSGFGHGVGMSQWGAYGMAKAGYDAAGIVTHYYSGTAVTSVQDDMDARINLLYQATSAKVRSEVLDPTGGAIEVTVGAVVTLGSPADEFRFAVGGAGVTVQKVTGGQPADLGSAPSVTVRWAGTRTPGTAAGGATLLNVVGSTSSLESSGHRYRFGYVEVVPAPGGARLNVVNSVRVHDEYLYGISEVSSSWPAAALQAQVLAARTYALSKVSRGVRQACSCHMDDGGGPYSDQTFTGWGKASGAMGGKWLDAVNATATSPTTGLAILYNGQPISAFYCASSGGLTQAARDAWGGTLPYAVSVADPWALNTDNPDRSWTVNVTQAQMARVFGVATIAKVDITQRYVSGAIRSVVGTAADGSTVTLSGNAFQGALRLKSPFVSSVGGFAGSAASVAVPAPAPAPGTVPAPAPAAPAPAPVAPAAPASAVQQRTVSLLVPTSLTVRAGHAYRVAGVVRPGKARLKTWRQLLVNGTWTTVEKTRTNGKGHYRFRAKAGKAGTTQTYRVLVVKKGIVVGVSAEFTVAVQP